MNIKDFFEQEKNNLKNLAKEYNVQDIIKLGIIDATAEDDAANAIYIKKKIEDFSEMGWKTQIYKTKNTTDAILKAQFDKCTAIIVQEPIAADAEAYSETDIPLISDVDGFNPLSSFDPATPKGIILYLDKLNFNYEGKNAVVLGRSDIVGKPMAKMLLDKNMNVVVLHSKTSKKDRAYYLANADLVIAAIGKSGFLTREECPHAVVIDVGISRGADRKIHGDFIENEKYVNENVWSTPVPGGVGLLTRLALMTNAVESARLWKELKVYEGHI